MIQVGDVVRLKSKGARMTVVALGRHIDQWNNIITVARCCWTKSSRDLTMETITIDINALEIVKE